jgi:secreted Zn-dependent insulinase-like peptidase
MQVHGFNHRLGVLFEKIVDTMAAFTCTPALFDMVRKLVLRHFQVHTL